MTTPVPLSPILEEESGPARSRDGWDQLMANPNVAGIGDPPITAFFYHPRALFRGLPLLGPPPRGPLPRGPAAPGPLQRPPLPPPPQRPAPPPPGPPPHAPNRNGRHGIFGALNRFFRRQR
ncbi:proline-rich protein 2 [Rhipicephalus sanguineus]|uniref:proline-rich protein 2 n=1 Tax=Rhipicephalus sanguineus TaxID=34632 RepID=UPI001893A25C|nr:proline-rich protein 2 [Rhipicephalus sanguineus]